MFRRAHLDIHKAGKRRATQGCAEENTAGSQPADGMSLRMLGSGVRRLASCATQEARLRSTSGLLQTRIWFLLVVSRDFGNAQAMTPGTRATLLI